MHPYLEGRPFLDPSPQLRYLLHLLRVVPRVPVSIGSSVGTISVATWDTLPPGTVILSTGQDLAVVENVGESASTKTGPNARTAAAGAGELSRSGTKIP
jgi:hypothetical protein